MRLQRFGLLAALALPVFAFGCGSRQQPLYAPAPPVNNVPINAPVNAGVQPVSNVTNGAYHWRDVPAGQTVPVVRATFDQGGYQIYAQTGEIIAVPFENQSLNVLKFGRSQNGAMYFVNEQGVAPILYLPNGAFLENAAAAGARWYPLPNDFAYTRPVYVSIAPSWSDWTGMGWYPGMTMYGGMWGYRPGVAFAWMPSFYINIGGSRYSNWGGYRTYYTSNPGYIRNRVVYNNYNVVRPTGRSFGSSASGGFTRSSSGSGYRSSGFGRSSSGLGSGGRSFGGSGGSFSAGRSSSGFGNSGSSSTFSGGSFGTGRSSSSFGGGSSFGGRSTGGSFSGSRSTGSSFGSGRTSGGSFFGGSRSSGSSFSSGSSMRSGGSSFGSGRSSFGGGGGSFGRRR